MVQFSSALAALAATALAVAPLANAESPAGTVKYTYERRRVSADNALIRPGLSSRQSKVVNALLSNEYLLYIINVTVGTPGQAISLQIDTGSSDIWFPSSSSALCQSSRTSYICQLLGEYNQASSSTYKTSPYASTPFQIQYVDGTEIEGTYINDVLNIGSTKITNLTMASATQLSRGFGIMGVGFDSGESSNVQDGFVYPNIVSTMKNQGLINTRSYSLWLDDLNADTGSILFGGVDKSKYTGSLVSVPIQKDSQSGLYTSFTVAWTGLTVTGSGNSANYSPSSPQPAILDSGTSLLYLPDSIASSIYSGVGVTNDRNYGPVVPCSLSNVDLSFSFTFGGANGAVIRVPLAEFVVPLQTTDGSQPTFRNGQAACQFGIYPAGSDPILFGDTFLRSAYVVYDLDELQIGLAQANLQASSSTQSVQAFSVSGGIPGVSSTASGASVSQTYTGRPLNTGSMVSGSATFAATNSATLKLSTGTTSATPTGTAGGSSSAGSSASASSSARNAAPRAAGANNSVFAVLAVTLAAFFFGAMLI